MTTDDTTAASSSNVIKKIEDQGKFTRYVVILCTAAILGGIFYMLIEIYNSLPSMIVTNFMQHMESIHHQWQALDRMPGAATTEGAK